MSLSTLHSLHEVGERMLRALESENYDAFCDLVQERDDLVNTLKSAERSADLEAAVRALGEQHVRLEEAMKAGEHSLARSLAAFARYRTASRAYRRSEPAGRLNQSLHG